MAARRASTAASGSGIVIDMAFLSAFLSRSALVAPSVLVHQGAGIKRAGSCRRRWNRSQCGESIIGHGPMRLVLDRGAVAMSARKIAPLCGEPE